MKGLKMFKKLLGGPKTGTARINSVVGQFEGMMLELDTGAQMNNDKMAGNSAQINALEVENTELDIVNTKARNVRSALDAIVNGG
jgi:hypothetical protein